MRLLLIVPFFVGALAFADAAQSTLTQALNASLPPQIQNLKPGTTTLTEIQGKLGTPAKIDDKTTFFYNLSGKDFDTTIKVDQANTLEYLIYYYPSGKLKLEQLSTWISKKQMASALESIRNQPEDHDRGRTFDLELPEINATLTINNNASKSIKLIVIKKSGAST